MSTASVSALFEPIALGSVTAKNRIVMAPLTRARADRAAVPQPVMAEYYAQRAGAGLIVSEATGISRIGLGWPHAPGLWDAAQVEGWKPITGAVHEAGGLIFAQLWHMGRLVHPSVGGSQPVSASPVAAPGTGHTYEGKQPHVEPRALNIAEIDETVADYAKAARNALAAGFDGVEVHGANGYLIDQFLRDNSNRREDDYGGSPENRVRFLREVVEAVTAEIGAGRTGLRLSPSGEVQGVIDSRPERVFGEAARMLSGRGLAYLHLREPRPGGSFAGSDAPPMSPLIRQLFDGPLMLNGEYDPAEAAAAVASGRADCIAFGRPFIANPDLAERIAGGAPLAESRVETWYSNGPEGYVDYPTWREAAE